MSEKKALVVDDQKNIRALFVGALKRDGFKVIEAVDGFSALEKLKDEKPHLCFLDNNMPGMTGVAMLKKMKEEDLLIPTILVTGHGNMQTAIEAVQLGVYEYTTKPVTITRIRVLAQRAWEVYQLNQKVKELEKDKYHLHTDDEILGNDPKIHDIYKSIGSITVTPVSVNVFISGESGTGKELIARAIHNFGPSKNEPFIDINCTALPETLLESELFGHEKGAFTGASEKRIGKFEAAGNGTLFLDEIGDMPLDLQKKLLRVLQERTFERLGSNRKIELRARIVSATNKNLVQEVEKGSFREDLYYRINETNISAPPLRDRGKDIAIIAEYFLNKYADEMQKRIIEMDAVVLQTLLDYDFPGNVRELANIIKSSVMKEKSNILTLDSLPVFLKKNKLTERMNYEFKSLNWKEERKQAINEFEKQFAIRLLQLTEGNLTKASEITQLDRKSLQRIIRKFDLSALDFRKK